MPVSLRAIDATFNVNGAARSDGYFQACTGAVIANVTSTPQAAQKASTTQMAALSSIYGPTLVTMTIGGNEGNTFAGTIMKLILLSGNCSSGSPGACEAAKAAYQNDMAEANKAYSYASLGKPLQSAYESILRKDPRITLMIVGYPSAFANTNAPVSGTVMYGTQADLYNLMKNLDNTVSSAVSLTAVNYPGRIFYVSAMAADSPFNGHGLDKGQSAGGSYFYNITPTIPAKPSANPADYFTRYSFHPNHDGQAAYAALIEAAIAKNAATIVANYPS